MSNQSFTSAILVDKTPAEAFDAINNVRGWWSQQIDGGTEHLNDEFTYRRLDLHSCKMKLTEVVPNKKVAWLVLENYFNFTHDQQEWIGTIPTFEISEKDNKTEIRFTHQGLVPGHECYNICHDAWSFYIQKSLRDLITTGKGQPNERED
ncbi:MAG: SRPBCC domain-containing protein [Mucilaginibacter sp.]|nr:SRPBCC domain-containing protein [Mucilaginibacter sp.]